MNEEFPYPFTAVIFDLDGVITRTALVHSHAWKQMFDAYLKERQLKYGEKFRAFSHERDYLQYVDGKPRYEGVRSFLESRGIHIPYGDPSDSPDAETICGLGNRKNEAFNEVLAREGAEVYPSTVRLMHELREEGISVGVASSSKNCRAVLEKAGLISLVETIVDGVVSAELGLKGKPEPDIFLTACRNLDSEPWKTIIVEDATSGVEAGCKGNFGLVIGITRENNEQDLLAHGADVVYKDLESVNVAELSQWFEKVAVEDQWKITYYGYDPPRERTRETLLTVGNGYFGTRGAMEEAKANPVNYPGTYMAGLYNRQTTRISGKDIENEDFVNCPNWLPVTLAIENGPWLNINSVEILEMKRELDFRTGLLSRQLIVKDDKDNITQINSWRFASMDDPHLAGIRYSIRPLNYSGLISVRSGIDGSIENAGVERYNSLNRQHLQIFVIQADLNQLHMVAQTTQSAIHIATAVRHTVFINDSESDLPFTVDDKETSIYAQYDLNIDPQHTFTLEKIAAYYTSRPDDTQEPAKAARERLNKVHSFERLLQKSSEAWDAIWESMDISVTGDRLSQKLLHLHMYHLLVSMSPHNKSLDAGITARGLHGEAYRGHVFWDELFILPFYALNFPEVARSMLMYRFRRLGKARENAAHHGFKGAMFPWQSGSDGREETQVIHLNPLNGEWDADFSSLQRHVSLAVAYNIWQYWQITGDHDFMKHYGAEMYFEICRFWASKSVFNEKSGRYDIFQVMGPDEFHEQYPGSNTGGLTNNAYTNLMIAWMMDKVDEIVRKTGHPRISTDEIEHWQHIAGRLTLDINADGIIAQFQGYFRLRELDWEAYRLKYGNISRLDRILKAEGLSPDEYKIAKQADMLMIFYTLEKEEVDRLLEGMGYSLPPNYLRRNFEYYFQRTSHGSTLSRVVHAWLAMLAGNPELSWELYHQALTSDFTDVQGGTTAEGIHTGVMASTLYLALRCFAGLKISNEKAWVNPRLPSQWKSMRFGILIHEKRYDFEVLPQSTHER